MKLYIYYNADLGENGTDFVGALCDSLEGDQDEILALFDRDYSYNDYSCSFVSPVANN